MKQQDAMKKVVICFLFLIPLKEILLNKISALRSKEDFLVGVV